MPRTNHQLLMRKRSCNNKGLDSAPEEPAQNNIIFTEVNASPRPMVTGDSTTILFREYSSNNSKIQNTTHEKHKQKNTTQPQQQPQPQRKANSKHNTMYISGSVANLRRTCILSAAARVSSGQAAEPKIRVQLAHSLRNYHRGLSEKKPQRKEDMTEQTKVDWLDDYAAKAKRSNMKHIKAWSRK